VGGVRQILAMRRRSRRRRNLQGMMPSARRRRTSRPRGKLGDTKISLHEAGAIASELQRRSKDNIDAVTERIFPDEEISRRTQQPERGGYNPNPETTTLVNAAKEKESRSKLEAKKTSRSFAWRLSGPGDRRRKEADRAESCTYVEGLRGRAADGGTSH